MSQFKLGKRMKKKLEFGQKKLVLDNLGMELNLINKIYQNLKMGNLILIKY